MNESLTNYETVDVILTAGGQLDSLFNYWISASFAVIVSAYVGRAHFNYAITLSISLLYLLACAMFATRFYSLATLVNYYIELAEAVLPAAFLDSISVLGFTRTPTFLGGVLVTEIYLWHSYRQAQTEKREQR